MSSVSMTKVRHNKSIIIYFLIPVFLGHEIPAVRHAFNTRDQIVAKANALAEPPQLLFDYDHRNNCEAFANLLIGAADLESGGGVKGVMDGGKCDSCTCDGVHANVTAEGSDHPQVL